MKNNFSDYPICSFIIVFIVIIFSLYFVNVIKTLPCGKDMKTIFMSNFIHTDFLHLISNVYGIYSLSRIEKRFGSKNFFTLLLFLLIFNTIFETLLHKIIKTPCSIGISGVLYGFLTFDIISNNKKSYDITLISAVFFNMIMAKIGRSNISFYGHLIGAISGIIGGLIYKKIKYI